MAVERAQLEVASPSEDDVRAADRLPSTPPPPPPPPPPPSLHRLHPSPVLYCESQRQPGRVSALCMCVCVCVCVCGCRSVRRRREVVSRSPSNISSTLHLSLAVWTAWFFFFLPASLFFFSSTHSLIQRVRARKRKSKEEREREKEREKERETDTAIPSQPAREPSYSATVELIKLMHTAAGTVLCVCVSAWVCVRPSAWSRFRGSGVVMLFCCGDLRCVRAVWALRETAGECLSSELVLVLPVWGVIAVRVYQSAVFLLSLDSGELHLQLSCCFVFCLLFAFISHFQWGRIILKAELHLSEFHFLFILQGKSSFKVLLFQQTLIQQYSYSFCNLLNLIKDA